ncbi:MULTISPECIES: hypothetical protein [Pantoea]|uniref:hypothetical protein n=1 Tax=Pantoea TaxID=53335 RepID=UPI0021193765|nr:MULTISPECIES: hypothetical protein [Pantoea]MDJ0089753.1 hypothetical protein [Pantoea allii]
MFKSLSDFKNSLKYSVVERVSNPLIAAFIFSWICLNWQIILILFLSKKDIEFRIKDMIDAGGVLVSLAFPVISAIFYVVVMPHIVEYAYKFQSGPFKRSQDKLADRIDNALKRKKTTEMLRAEADIAYDRKTTDAEKEIEQMRLGINELKEQNGEKEKNVNALIKEKNELNDKIKILSKEKSDISQESFQNRIERDEIKKITKEVMDILDSITIKYNINLTQDQLDNLNRIEDLLGQTSDRVLF